MGLNHNSKNKKPAMALVLLLVILTGLAIVIASTMKILVGSDSRFSINRNARGGASNTLNGQFICYKDSNGYHSKLIKYTNGNPTETTASNCNFNISQQGSQNYIITLQLHI